MSHKFILSPILLVSFIFIITAGCKSELERHDSAATSTPASTPAVSVPAGFSGQPLAIQQLFPFTVVTPSYLPDGLMLKSLDLSRPPLPIAAHIQQGETVVSLNYEKEHSDTSLRIQECLCGIALPADKAREDVDLLGAGGQMTKDDRKSDISIVWRDFNQSFRVTSHNMPLEDVVRISRSIVSSKRPAEMPNEVSNLFRFTIALPKDLPRGAWDVRYLKLKANGHVELGYSSAMDASSFRLAQSEAEIGISSDLPALILVNGSPGRIVEEGRNISLTWTSGTPKIELSAELTSELTKEDVLNLQGL